eukprot:TRINITY_DN43383_c0_g1_i1.p1 TRINITY_DN43383_c0_g1~~TRINITY_DN43383_c0_g1_i1.p1  ORF type:complete len:536 (+),score=179.18 TRINITY_DN43383_c0_g1_i1:86-1609(+)
MALLPLLGGAASAVPPHLLFVLSDDLGYSNVGFHNPLAHTPNLDQLKKEGVELTQHYAYKYCSPSRSSFLSGRLPVHVNEHNKPTEAPRAGVPVNMTMVSAQLKQAGYRTHHVGKWHAGFGSRSMNLPIVRGFDSSFGYFHGAEDHYLQNVQGNVKCPGAPYTDLWEDHGPAVGINGTNYSMFLYRDRVLRLIAAHPLPEPFFLFLAFANNHEPLEVPARYKASYPTPGSTKGEQDWTTYQAMITAVDESIGEVTAALKARGMWADTLLVWTSDNGGPVYGGGGANNYPFRGGKISQMEGGFRVPALIAGGVVPVSMHGAELGGPTFFCDWYATFLTAAGLEVRDKRAEAAGLPGIDGRDLHGMFTAGEKTPWAGVPVLLSSHAADPVINPQKSTTLIMDNWKLITGTSVCSYVQGPHFPNASGYPGAFTTEGYFLLCGEKGCLYDVDADPGESRDLVKEQPAKAAELLRYTEQEAAKVFNPDRGDPGNAPCEAAEAAGGYWAPFLP